MVRMRWWRCSGAALGHASGQLGFGPETRNRVPDVRLWVRCEEWLSGAIGGGCWMVRTRWWWCGGAALGHASG
jgi:hypothetical protein